MEPEDLPMINRRLVARGLLLGLLPVVAGCVGATPALAPSASVTSTVLGWEQWFRVDWAAEATAGGNEIQGYVYNGYGQTAMNVRVLAQGLDPAGAIVDQKLAWVPGGVPALNRAPFRVAGLQPAQRYRVSVWAFDFVQGAGDVQR
jgi:hypothetical protein